MLTPAKSCVVVPVRYHDWVHGDIGRSIEALLSAGLPGAVVERLPRALVVRSPAAAGVLVEQSACAARALEVEVQRLYPVMYNDYGPVWTGTLQAVYAAT